MKLTLQAASARRHSQVPKENLRKIVWVIAERPQCDSRGRKYLRVVIDVNDVLCWPEYRRVWCDTIELMSPENYPAKTVIVRDVRDVGDVKEPINRLNSEIAMLFRRLRQLGYNHSQIARAIDCTPSAIRGWYSGRHMPRNVYCERLAQLVEMHQ
jgi:hypothetical protein